MSEDLVIRHCAPTLAGIKTGNLFSCACPCKAALTKELCRLNRKLVPKGIRILPLKVRKGRALIYVYRPNALECDLADHRSRGLLLRYGYTPGDSNRCVIHLIRRLRSDGEFPHEIGLFLGYPPDDVEGFIRWGAQCYKCVGDWKVYGDEAQARRLFDQYRRCTRAYQALWRRGKTVEQLAVAQPA